MALLLALKLLLQIRDAGLGLMQRVILNQHGLRQHIGRIRLVAHQVADHAFGLGIAVLGRRLTQPGDEVGEKFTFLLIHRWPLLTANAP